MNAPRRTPPQWLDTSLPLSDRPRTQQCPRCRRPILRALVGNPCGLDVKADPYPLDIRAELAARLAGRFSYCLRLHPWLPARLVHRGPEHTASGRCTHIVVADHICDARGSSTPVTLPEHDQLF